MNLLSCSPLCHCFALYCRQRKIQVWLVVIAETRISQPFRTPFSAIPPIKSFSKFYRLKAVDVCETANWEFVQTVFNSQRLTKGNLGQTDVDSSFNHQNFDISQSRHRIGWLAKALKKSSMLSFCSMSAILRHSSDISSRRSDFSFKRKFGFLLHGYRDFPGTFEQASKCLQVSLPKPKVHIDLWKQWEPSLLITMEMTLNNRLDKFVYRSDLKTKNLAIFPTKTFIYTGIKSCTHMLSFSRLVKLITFRKTDIIWQTKVNFVCEHLRCVTYSSLYYDITFPFLASIWLSTVRIKCIL